MRSIFTLILLLPFLAPAFCQTLQWQQAVKVEDVYVRLEEPYIVDSITVEVPSDGKILLWFDGNCTSSPGDRITIAISNFRSWLPNDGNNHTQATDSIHLINPISHTRVYPVMEGSHTFYLLGHNWVDRNGTGIASIEGKLSVEFVPDASETVLLESTGIIHGPEVWLDTPTIIQTLEIEVPSNGQLLVSVDGRVAIRLADEAYLALSLEPEWPDQTSVAPIRLNTSHRTKYFTHRQAYQVGPGTHTIYLLSKKISSDYSIKDDWTYATLSAYFVADQQEETFLIKESVENTEVVMGTEEELGAFSLGITKPGTITIQMTGKQSATPDNRVKYSIISDAFPDSVLSSLIVESTEYFGLDNYFSVSQTLQLTEGQHSFKVLAEHDENGDGSGLATVNGSITAKYGALPEVTSSVQYIPFSEQSNFYPNPATDVVYGSIPGKRQDMPCTVRILDSTGKVIKRWSVTLSDHIEVDMRSLSEGVYYFQLIWKEGIETHPVVRVRK